METKERYNAHAVTVIYTVHKPSTSFSKRARGITVFSHLKSLSFKKTTCVSFSCKLGSAHEWSGAGFELACFRLLVVGNERKRGRAREKNKHDGLSPPLLFLSLAFFFISLVPANYREPGKYGRFNKLLGGCYRSDMYTDQQKN